MRSNTINATVHGRPRETKNAVMTYVLFAAAYVVALFAQALTFAEPGRRGVAVVAAMVLAVVGLLGAFIVWLVLRIRRRPLDAMVERLLQQVHEERDPRELEARLHRLMAAGDDDDWTG